MFIPADDDSKKALRSSHKKRRTSKALEWVFLLYAHDAGIEVPLGFLGLSFVFVFVFVQNALVHFRKRCMAALGSLGHL